MDKYENFIWDWNGTLFNDVELCVHVINDILKKENLPEITVERYKELFEFPVKKYYRNLGFDFEQSSFEELGTEFVKGYNNRRFECDLNTGIKSLLKEIKKYEKKQFVLSAREHYKLLEDLKHYKIETFFTDIVGLDNHFAAGKIELGKSLLKKHALLPEKCVMIGDTLHDAEVAKELKIDCLLVATGHHTFERLESAGVPVFNSFHELAVVLKDN